MEIEKNEERLVSVERSILSSRIDMIISDFLYISDNLDYQSFDNNDLKDFEKELKAFSDRKKIYDQIRYIDTEGNERLRINYSENGSFVVNKDELQNKKDKYYFKDTIDLKKEQIYISKYIAKLKKIPLAYDQYLNMLGKNMLEDIDKEYDVAISNIWPHSIVVKKVKAKKKIGWIHTDYSQMKISYKLDIYPNYGSDATAALKSGMDAKFALIGPGVFASHGYERTHIKSIVETVKLIIAYITN